MAATACPASLYDIRRVRRYAKAASGTGWRNKKGGINCKVPPGIALPGEFTILPRTGKAEDDGPVPDEAE